MHMSQQQENSLVDAVVRYIHINYNCQITLEALCSLYHSNRTSLTTQFKRQTGLTVMQYITDYRIKVAKESLALSELSVHEIAMLCGFRYESYFTKIFIQTVGVPPTQYRKETVDARKKRYFNNK